MVTAHLLIFVNESYDLFPAATKEQAVWKFFSDEKRQRKGQEFSMENLVICERGFAVLWSRRGLIFI